MQTPDTTHGGTQPDRRRARRLLRDVPLLVRGESIEHRTFQEETFTISISDSGALIVLAAQVMLGQRLVLVNLETRGEVGGVVSRFGAAYGGLAQVGIEFSQPAPDFWPPGLLH